MFAVAAREWEWEWVWQLKREGSRGARYAWLKSCERACLIIICSSWLPLNTFWQQLPRPRAVLINAGSPSLPLLPSPVRTPASLTQHTRLINIAHACLMGSEFWSARTEKKINMKYLKKEKHRNDFEFRLCSPLLPFAPLCSLAARY